MVLFSIIIPSYNNVRLLAKAIDSVLNQDFKQFELIITDDSESDDVERYCNNLANTRVKYFKRNNRIGGPVGNWNSGLRNVSGEYIIILHHDEELGDTHFLSRAYSYFSQGYVVVISDVRVIEEGSLPRKGRVNGILKKVFLKFPSLLLAINAIGPCACLAFSKKILQEFDEKLTWVVDTEWYYRMLKTSKNRTYLRDSIVYSNSGHKDQITLNINIDEKEKTDIEWLKIKYKTKLSVITVLGLRSIIKVFRRFIRKIR